MRRTYSRERFLDRVALIREHVPGLRDHHRHHRRLPGGDRGGLRADARGRRGGRLRRRLHVHLLAAARDRGGRRSPTSSSRTRCRSSAWSGSSRSSSGARASARSASSGGRSTCWSRAPSRTDPSRLRGRTRHNKVVNFGGLAQPGELVRRRDHRGDEPDAAGRGALVPAGSGRLVARDQHARRRRLRLRQPEARERALVGEQAASRCPARAGGWSGGTRRSARRGGARGSARRCRGSRCCRPSRSLSSATVSTASPVSSSEFSHSTRRGRSARRRTWCCAQHLPDRVVLRLLGQAPAIFS